MSPTIARLSTLWCVLVIAPALITRWLFVLGTDTPIRGWVLGVWIAGYVAQLLVFMAIARRSPRGTAPGWLIASILPWIADWTAPASLWGPFVCAVIVIAYVTWLTKSVQEVDRLRTEGWHREAVVVEAIRPLLNVVVNKVYIPRTLRLRVESGDGTTGYETSVKGKFLLGEVPEPGDRLAVLVDPQLPQRIELIDGAPIERAAPLPTDLDPDVAEQLHRLVTMRDRGDLTDAEFAAARRRLLDP